MSAVAAPRLRPLLAMVALVLAAGSAAAQPWDPTVRITNGGGRSIEELYVASAGAATWGDDRLGRGSLGTGQSTTVRLPANQCVNDIRAVLSGGEVRERRRVNTCSEGDVVLR